MSDVAFLRHLLTQQRRIAVVGLSADPTRPSHVASEYLLDHGYAITPVNPKYETVLGLPCYPSLTSIPHPVDVVDLFQRSERVAPFVEDAIAIGAKTVWMQLGVVNHEAASRARAAGLGVIMDRCMKIEHARIFGSQVKSEIDANANEA